MSLNRGLQKATVIAISLVLLFNTFYGPFIMRASAETVGLQVVDSNNETGLVCYSEYRKNGTVTIPPDETITIQADHYTKIDSMEGKIYPEYAGNEIPALLSEENGWIEWDTTVAKEGFYQISFSYCSVAGRGLDIERQLMIDGDVPFEEANSLMFSRIWKDEAEPSKDSHGNQYRAEQKEQFIWQTLTLNGNSQYLSENFQFYFTKGIHTLRLVSVSEAMMIEKICLSPMVELPSYKQISEEWKGMGYTEATGNLIRKEAEDSLCKSDQILYPVNDNSSPATEPYGINKILLNSIGGVNWRYIGQWIRWEVSVPKSGLYRLAFREKQNYAEGTNSCRSLLVDGKTPFVEAKNISFSYNFNWQMVFFGGETPYLIYFDEGIHTLEMQVTLGKIGPIISGADEILSQLNIAYRKILMLAGSYPDADRDYDLENKLPECIVIFRQQMENLKNLRKQLLQITGNQGADYARLQRLELQLSDFIENPDTIPERLDNFRSNLSDCSSWIVSATEQPLLLDSLFLLPKDTTLPAADVIWYAKAYNELMSLVYSFISDYNDIGNEKTMNSSNEITLWLGSVGSNVSAGRDQAQIMKNLINRGFSPSNNINVNIQLVDLGSLLPAVAAGMGPDVAINQTKSIPVTYALRNAVLDLNRFDDLDKVLMRFDKSSYSSYVLENKLYALPETQVYSMMFYRNDILKDLGISVPNTWTELIADASILQMNYMDVGLINLADENPEMFYTLLYQTNGQVYNQDNSRTALDSVKAIQAFSQWTGLYTEYKIAQKMNALTRFRTGEAPIVIQPYTFYNSLSATAPEIRGLWSMTTIPGTLQENGSLSRCNISDGMGCVIFANTKNPNASWEFLKWWTSSDTQVKYGQDIEVLQGESGRWPTANNEAMSMLPWNNKALKNLLEQKAFTIGIPEIPGGYMTPRYLMNAARLVVNNDLNPRETLLNYNNKINNEIKVMRQEYGFEEADK